MLKNIGYTRLHTIKMNLHDFWFKLTMMIPKRFRKVRFCSDVVEDGIKELKIPSNAEKMIQKEDRTWEKDPNDDGNDYIWVAKI